ncbi:hypothetical protein [Pseudoalteromonas luteoviolacea]|uniref:hypothetical protein n=1 Tax=Pseudoalteromonas luteoviolacea TaxID=43657 RepID=UPI001B38A56E|nr:hypothetical protein [Pseudoalteromonas luteoviolacea]MBQ4837165.1 hypothetical protein [Pseudoalteromonas luteoviolacea]
MSLLKLLLSAVFVLQIVLFNLALYIPSIVIAASFMLYFLKRYNALSHMGLAALGLCLSYGFLSIWGCNDNIFSVSENSQCLATGYNKLTHLYATTRHGVGPYILLVSFTVGSFANGCLRLFKELKGIHR